MRFNEQRGETQHHSVHHVMQAWPGAEPSGVYKSSKAKKNEQLESVGAARGSGSDSGVSGGHWTDSERSPLAPEVRLQRDFVIGGGGADSGIATPVSIADDKGLAGESPMKAFSLTYGFAAWCHRENLRDSQIRSL
ncbi:hypothetical protein J437_LFUL003928 [Ladona fulva]|uniref:Uncharacterized protein n=1 Tax=Ladona fulva TaxID=123851 RepID=A0A8K0KC28_LADFU|nr:hypothetical protein J437_LFUL003928 [Ladona fulva]